MSTYLDGLIAKQAEAGNRMKEIILRAESEQRALTAEDNANLEQTDKAYDEYKAEADRLSNYSKKVAAADELRAAIEPAMAEARALKPANTDAENLRRLFANKADRATLEWDTKLSDQFFRANHTGSQGPMEARALATGTATVPVSFSDRLWIYERTLNPTMDLATVLNTATGENITLPVVTADASSGGTVTAQAGGISEVDPTISAVTLSAYKLAITNLYSFELGQDNAINLEDMLARTSGRDIGLGWGAFFTTGSGSSQPRGFVVAGTNGGTATGTAYATPAGTATEPFFALPDLIDLFYGLAAPYRAVATWMVATGGPAKLRKFRSSTGEFLWESSLQAGQPDNFLGRPLYENPAMAAIASASKSVAVGDFSRYVIRQVPSRVDVSDQYKFSSDQLALRIVTRRDGALPDAAAIRYLVSANT